MLYRVCKNKDNPYIMIDKRFLNDETLSWKAKGILAYLLTLPNEWKIYQTELAKHSKDGLDSLRSGIQELIKNGYIIRQQLKDESGKFIGYEYNVFENPTICEDLPRMGISVDGKSIDGNPPPNNKYNKIINNKNNIYNNGEVITPPIPKQKSLINNLTNNDNSLENDIKLEKTKIREIKDGKINKEILSNPVILEITKNIIEYLNYKAKKRFKINTKISIGLVGYYLGQGYKEDDFKNVIDKKCREWLGTEFEKFLRPETLFGEKFESYLNEPERFRYKDQYKQQDRDMEEMQRQYEKERELIDDEDIGVI